jgi:hypothetical protein
MVRVVGLQGATEGNWISQIFENGRTKSVLVLDPSDVAPEYHAKTKAWIAEPPSARH